MRRKTSGRMAVERFFHELWANRVLDAVAAAIAKYGIIACALFAVLAFFRRPSWRAAGACAIGGLAAACLEVAAGAMHYAQRPFAALRVAPLVAHAADNAFPSDHSAAAAYIATFALYLDCRLGLASWVCAAALGVARAYCLLHAPVDIVAGWLIGAVPALLAGAYLKRRS